MPLLRVLIQQSAMGITRVESSQLGSLLSKEAPPLAALYERAGVDRLGHYIDRAATRGILRVVGELKDGHRHVELCWTAAGKK